MSLPTFEAIHAPRIDLPEVREGESASESVPVALLAASRHDEPVVTRRELGSYYRVYQFMFCFVFARSLTASLQYITLGITYVLPFLLVIQRTRFQC